MLKRLFVTAASLVLMAFSLSDAKRQLDGQWQSLSTSSAISLDVLAGTGVYLDAGVRTAGPLRFGEVVARTVEIQIGDTRYFMALSDDNNSILVSKEGERNSWTFKRVK